MQGCAGVSQGEAIEASVTAATQSPGAQQIPGPALVGGGAGDWAGDQQESHRPFLPAPLTSNKGDRDHAGSLLRKGRAKSLAEWVNGGTNTHTHTHNLQGIPGCLSCLWAWWEKGKIT